MPVRLESNALDSMRPGTGGPAGSLSIGLVNNMPDGALQATERQFIELLAASSSGQQVNLRLFSLADVPRGSRMRAHLARNYTDASHLPRYHLDGLIVTGTEPRAASLGQEPYWSALSGLVDWAAQNTRSAIWSCLACHAAVLHLDGVARAPLGAKCSGIFEFAKVGGEPLARGIPEQIRMPHSRCNGLREDELIAAGYTILTRSPTVGVDSFIKRLPKSLFVFFQGHPEYDAASLLREYQRDVGRFLKGERASYPAPPEGYFDPQASAQLESFAERARGERRLELIEGFPSQLVATRLTQSWRAPAVQIYRNWLDYLRCSKATAQDESFGSSCAAE